MGSFVGCAALKADGEPWMWGRSFYGSLGDGTTIDKSSPILVIGSHLFTQISGGFDAIYSIDHVAALKNDGSVWSWGYGQTGQIGNNAADNKSSPVMAVGDHNFIEVSAGAWHTLARKSNGEVWSWGGTLATNTGFLGDNATVNRSSPILVVGNHSFVEISAGSDRFSLARKADGTVWAWGLNTDFGQLGDGTTTDKSSPVLVIGNHSFVEISAGYDHCIARKNDGTVWTWGRGANGRLGDGTTTNRSSPVLVIGNHSFVEISAAGGMSLCRKSDGTVWTFGYNQDGELGDGTITHRSSPVLVIGNHSFVGISGQYLVAFGRKANGETWAWGIGTSGGLGDWTATSKSSPVAVVGTV